jgi:nucleolar protein 4
VLHGRTLDVVRAVTRDVAGKLKEDNERMREKADKRNLYLLREGGNNTFFLACLRSDLS